MERNISQIEILFKSIIAVEKPYLKYGMFSEEIKKFETSDPVERVFAYELYHQWSIRFCHDHLRLNGEITKCTDEGVHYYPDLVLHSSQENSDKQEIVCEIKRYCILNQDNGCIDLQKLKLFVSGEDNDVTFNHPFAYGVFIVIGCNMKDLLGKVSIDENSKNIIIVAYNEPGHLQFVTADDPKNQYTYTNETLSEDLTKLL